MEQTKKSDAAYGCFLIIPLKYDPDSFDQARLEQIGSCMSMTTMDLNENIKAMLSPSGEAAVGKGYLVASDMLTAPLRGQAEKSVVHAFQVCDGIERYAFELGDSWL